jgi:hypothetical protein
MRMTILTFQTSFDLSTFQEINRVYARLSKFATYITVSKIDH